MSFYKRASEELPLLDHRVLLKYDDGAKGDFLLVELRKDEDGKVEWFALDAVAIDPHFDINFDSDLWIDLETLE